VSYFFKFSETLLDLYITTVACCIGSSANLFENRGNSTYENCFVGRI